MKRYITWKEVFERLNSFNFSNEIVYGIPKGGMIATGFMETGITTYEPQHATVFLDDLIDSGATRDKYAELYPNTPFVALFDKQKENITDWLIFPWEAQHPQKEDNIQDNIVRILQYIGEDTKREGLLETPERVVRMYKEIFRGYNPECKPKVSIFKNGKDNIRYDEMIIDTGDYYSHCEHHMVPFFGKYWFAYLPSPEGGIIGLSKVARIIDYHAAKLQIQERLVNDIVEDLWSILSDGYAEPLGMALIMTGEHLCKTMRGAKKKGTMTTSKMKGVFLNKPEAKAELMQLIRQ